MRIFGVEEQARPMPVHTGSIWHFSKTEVQHLTQATLALSLALAFMSVQGIRGALAYPELFILGGVVYLIALAPAFLLHEIAHKVVARKYGCWAEFRASPSGLRFGVLLAAILGIVFMAPGAVMVAGHTTRAQFGKIALAGPVTNVALWLLGLIAILLGAAEPIVGEIILKPWLWGNAVLALFNMLPFGPLDGKKIRTWSIPVFWIWLIICVSLVWFNFTHLNSLLG
jgi:Zn-dependent protease